MKVKDLIQELQKLDPELLVVVAGYEGGVDEVKNLTQYKIELDAHKDWAFFGDHRALYDIEDRFSLSSTIVDGVKLEK
jgi:hypothetical protein